MSRSNIDFSKPTPSWERFRLSSEDARTVRLMLNIDDDEEIHRTLLLAMAMYQALVGDQFQTEGFTPRVLAFLALQSDILAGVDVKGDFYPGQRIMWKGGQQECVYVCRGPIGKDLISVYGTFHLVLPKDLAILEEPEPKEEPESEVEEVIEPPTMGAVKLSPTAKVDLQAALLAKAGV